MKIGGYLRDRIPMLLLLLIASVLSYVLMRGTGCSRDAALFVVSLYALMMLIWVAIDLVRKYAFYRDIEHWLRRNRAENLPANRVERPGFAEGQALYDAVERLDTARQEALARHAQSAREYREYIESWVHEIKTPLASASLYLENHPTPERRLENELRRVEGYVSQVLYYARAASLEKDFRVRATSLSDLVRELLKKNSLLLIEAGFSVVQQGLELTVLTDAAWLEFVLTQVVSNAVKYRSKAPRLEFFGERRPHAVLLRVKDNGVGIPEADLPHVFDKSFSGENGRALGKSTGMGLYIAKKLCDKMGLGIEIASVRGESTCVTLCFPVGDAYILTKS
jgi:signal transduction histidine kinase